MGPERAYSVLGTDLPGAHSWSTKLNQECELLITTTNELMRAPWEHPDSDAFHVYFTAGVRADYDTRVEADVRRLACLVLANLAQPRDDRMEAMLEGLRGLATREHWHLPAHERDRPRRGEHAPTEGNRSLDMCAAEIGALVAWALVLHRDEIATRDAALAALLRVRVLDKVVHRYLQCDAAWLGPLTRPTNWNPWINHQVLTTTLLLSHHDEEITAVRQKVAASLDSWWRAVPDDGAIEEGFTYWWQGASHYLTAQSILARCADEPALGSEPDPQRHRDDSAKLLALVQFPASLCVDRLSCLTFSDSERHISEDLPWQIVHQVATELGDEGLAADSRRLASRRVPLPSMTLCLEYSLRSLLDDRWTPTAATAWQVGRDDQQTGHRATPTCYRSVGLHVSRLQHCGTQWVVGASLGNNGQLHNHLDVGSFALWVDGHPVVLDLGAPTYNDVTFGPHRYLQWGLGSEWHSTLTIDGYGQAVGSGAAATEVECGPSFDQGWRHVGRLETAYPASRCARWTRCLDLVPRHEALTVEDTWTWTEGGGTAQATLMLSGASHRVDGGVVIKAGEREVVVTLDGAADMLLEHHRVEDPRQREAWGPTVCRLLITAADSSDSTPGALRTSFAIR